MPREFSRGQRVGDLIQKELALLIQQEIKDPRLGMVTITEAKVSRDLAFADVYFTMLPEENSELGVEVLTQASGFLRSQLAKILSTRDTKTQVPLPTPSPTRSYEPKRSTRHFKRR